MEPDKGRNSFSETAERFISSEVGDYVDHDHFSQGTLAEPLLFESADLLGRLAWMCVFGKVFSSYNEKKTVSKG